LVELLVAMTLLGLLMVVLFGGLRFGARAWERAEDHSSGTDGVRLAQELLRHELEQAYPYFIATDPLHPHVDFTGTADEVELLGPAPAALNTAGRARVIFRRAESDGRIALVVEARPELALEEVRSQREVLVRGLTSLEFAYYGSERLNDAPQWTDRWIERTRLPQLVRIKGEFAGGDGRAWPELVVALRISADVSCVYDVLTNYCRGR